MFGGECLSIFKIQILIACWTNSIPFEWDRKANRIKHVRSRTRLIIWGTYVFLIFLYTRFVLLRLIQTSPHVNIHVRLLHFGWLVAYIASSQIHLLSVMRRKEIILLINGLIEFENSNVQDDHLSEDLRAERNKGRWFLWFGVICSFSFPILTSLPVWFLPCSPQFPSSLLFDCARFDENFTYLQYLLKLPFLVLEMMLIALTTHAAYVYLTLLIFSPTSFDIYVKQISTTLPNLNLEYEMKRRCQIYRQVQLLHKLYHEIFQFNWLPGLEAQLCVLVTLGLYGMVDLKGIIEMPGYLCFPALVVTGCTVVSYLFRMADDCYKSSDKLIKSWREMRNDTMPKFQERWIRRFSLSCPKFRIRVGSWHNIDNRMILILLSFCIEHAISLIIMF